MIQTNAASADEDKAFENAKRILNSKKGSFYPEPEYGIAANPSDESEAACLAGEALKSADGVFVAAAEKMENAYKITLIANGKERTVNIEF